MKRINKLPRKNIAIVLIGALLLGLIIYTLTNNKSNIISITPNNVKIKNSETKQIELVNYDHSNFSMKIPKDWKVETDGDGMYFSIRVYKPTDSRYQIFAILKAEPLLKNNKAKTWYENYYNSFGGLGNKMLAKAIVLPNKTVECFYTNFNNYVNFTKEMNATFNAPDLGNFKVIESFDNNSQLKSIARDDKVLRATFTDSKTNKNGEGLFMGSLVEPTSNNMLGYDVTFYTVYNVIGITTGQYDLINYENILTKSLNSLVYKDSFVNQTINDIKKTTQNALSINKSINDAFSSYNSAWSNRQKTYDITSQKYSDATLGYERVYDTKTNEVYKAYNGFTDDYTGSRYKAIDDNMYTKSISGYIEK